MRDLKIKAQMLIVGFALGLSVAGFYLIATGNLPFIKAAGVGTGAADINAKYHDGYATSLTAGASKVYVSDGSNYLPDSTVDSGAIVNGSVTSTDIANGTIVSTNISDGATLSEILDDDGAGSGLDADTLDGSQASAFFQNVSSACISEGTANSNKTGQQICVDAGYDFCTLAVSHISNCTGDTIISCHITDVGHSSIVGSATCINLY